MLGLVFVVFFLIYFYFIYNLARFTFRKLISKKSARSTAYMGSSFVALIGVLLIFWDAIPTRYTHYRLCSDEGGLTVYQSPEEWAKANEKEFMIVKENAGRRFEDAIRSEEKTSREIISRTELTHNFIYEFRHYKGFNYAFQNDRHKESLIFKPTGQVLFESVDFFGAAGRESLANNAGSISDYKFWTVTGSCKLISKTMANKFLSNGSSFSELLQVIDGWNEK